MIAIWKFTLQAVAEQSVEMPSAANILSVQAQGGRICIWAEVDDHDSTKPRRFRIIGTGWPLPRMDDFRYLGTVQIGAFVWHVFGEL